MFVTGSTGRGSEKNGSELPMVRTFCSIVEAVAFHGLGCGLPSSGLETPSEEDSESPDGAINETDEVLCVRAREREGIKAAEALVESLPALDMGVDVPGLSLGS